MKHRKRYSNSLMKSVKDTTGIGIGSMAGLSAMGTVKNLIPGGAGNDAFNSASSGMNMLNLAQMVKNSKKLYKF